MGNITTTAGTLGFAAACADVLVWRLNGHPLPIPDDVTASFGVLFGVGFHALGMGAGWCGSVAAQILDKKFGITPVNPTDAGP